MEVPSYGDWLELRLLLVETLHWCCYGGGNWLLPLDEGLAEQAKRAWDGQGSPQLLLPSPCMCVGSSSLPAVEVSFRFSSSKAGADCRGVAISLVLLIPLLSSSIRRFGIILLPLGLGCLLPSLK